MWIDSHCHLNHERNAEGDNPSAIIARAKAAGVSGMVNINCQIVAEFPTIIATANAHENVWCTVGTHPHDAGVGAEKSTTLDELISIANSHDKVIGIGESGLDYFYDNAPRADQEESFRKHIRVCIATDLPLVVHARDADEDIIRIIRSENPDKKLRGVMHCFSSSPRLAHEALEEGFYISASGIVTFKKSTELQEIFKTVPLERILVETDAPFLAPMPHRGKTNEPAYVTHTGEYVANLLEVDTATFADTTTHNFFTLFNKAKKTWAAN
jgi:TatD DNase family protein